jgi:hypothetical protein
MLSIRDIFSGKVKWVRRVGWCDQPFVSISLHPVEQPTEQQIRYVQSISTYADQNFLQIRRLLQQGGQIALGLHLPDDAERLGSRLRELGFSYSTQQERVYRPR